MKKSINANYSGEWYYNWKDDIQEVPDYEDDIWYDVAENMIASNQKEYEDYDVWDIVSDIINLWKIEKRSRLYDYLLKWYGSEAELLNNVRDVYNTRDAIYFVTGCGYSIWSADLLGGSADGRAEREFDRFVDNGGKRIESSKSIKASGENYSLKDIEPESDVIFLPGSGSVLGYGSRIAVVYFNEEGGENSDGCFEIELMYPDEILEAYEEAKSKMAKPNKSSWEADYDMYDYFHDALAAICQGGWECCDTNCSDFQYFIDNFNKADYVPNGAEDEMNYLVNWAKSQV